ncbi:MAG: lytic transglycosylase [Deltaproteobacteria bacterium]|nr:MAG: lytic transglycosylase [Deltaproteobacteria bacterium]
MRSMHVLFRLMRDAGIAMLLFCLPAGATLPDTSLPVYQDYPIPTRMTLCGERVPVEQTRVFEMLDREVTISAWDHAQTFMWIKRAGRFFPYIEHQLINAKVPTDLKYLAVAESALIEDIQSPAGAIGVWQFMPATGRKHGLRKDRWVDERRSVELATVAAIQYLKELKETFGSWTLAMAAYNCGENRMARMMKAQKQTNYFNLDLPRETERYIFRILAIKLIMESPEQYGYVIDPKRIYKPMKKDRVVAAVSCPIPIQDVAESLQITYKQFKEMNRHFTNTLIPKGKFLFCVPPGKGGLLTPAIKRIIKEQKPVTYIVRKGDSLIRISQKTGVPLSQLKQLNRLKGSLIVPGQHLRLK